MLRLTTAERESAATLRCGSCYAPSRTHAAAVPPSMPFAGAAPAAATSLCSAARRPRLHLRPRPRPRRRPPRGRRGRAARPAPGGRGVRGRRPDVATDRFAVPGKGRSRNVIGVLDTPRRLPAGSSWRTPTRCRRRPAPRTTRRASARSSRSRPSLAALHPALRRLARRHRRRGADLHRAARPPRARARWSAASARAGPATCAGRCRSTRSAAGARCGCARRGAGGFERRVLAAAAGTGLDVRWVADGGRATPTTASSRLAGYTRRSWASPDNPRRHTAADVAGRLQHADVPARAQRCCERSR